MSNLKTLKPFKKGEKRTIDAAKKSKRRPYDQIIRGWLESPAGKIFIHSSNGKALLKELGVSSKASVDEAFRLSQFLQGLKGNQQAIKDLRDRAYGQARQNIDVNVDGEVSVSVKTDKRLKKELERIYKRITG